MRSVSCLQLQSVEAAFEGPRAISCAMVGLPVASVGSMPEESPTSHGSYYLRTTVK